MKYKTEEQLPFLNDSAEKQKMQLQNLPSRARDLKAQRLPGLFVKLNPLSQYWFLKFFS